jgi:hypothetical protein
MLKFCLTVARKATNVVIREMSFRRQDCVAVLHWSTSVLIVSWVRNVSVSCCPVPVIMLLLCRQQQGYRIRNLCILCSPLIMLSNSQKQTLYVNVEIDQQMHNVAFFFIYTLPPTCFGKNFIIRERLGSFLSYFNVSMVGGKSWNVWCKSMCRCFMQRIVVEHYQCIQRYMQLIFLHRSTNHWSFTVGMWTVKRGKRSL